MHGTARMIGLPYRTLCSLYVLHGRRFDPAHVKLRPPVRAGPNLLPRMRPCHPGRSDHAQPALSQSGQDRRRQEQASLQRMRQEGRRFRDCPQGRPLIPTAGSPPIRKAAALEETAASRARRKGDFRRRAPIFVSLPDPSFELARSIIRAAATTPPPASAFPGKTLFLRNICCSSLVPRLRSELSLREGEGG